MYMRQYLLMNWQYGHPVHLPILYWLLYLVYYISVAVRVKEWRYLSIAMNWFLYAWNVENILQQSWTICEKVGKCSLINTLAAQWGQTPQIARSIWPTWGPPGSCRPQMGPMVAPWTLLAGTFSLHGGRQTVISSKLFQQFGTHWSKLRLRESGDGHSPLEFRRIYKISLCNWTLFTKGVNWYSSRRTQNRTKQHEPGVMVPLISGFRYIN